MMMSVVAGLHFYFWTRLVRDTALAPPWSRVATWTLVALAVSLHQKGLFSWTEWAAALAAQITRAQAQGDADLGDTYYRHWLAALESLVAAKGASSAQELGHYRDAWDRAADRTPHGQPIELQPRDFDPA